MRDRRNFWGFYCEALQLRDYLPESPSFEIILVLSIISYLKNQLQRVSEEYFAVYNLLPLIFHTEKKNSLWLLELYSMHTTFLHLAMTEPATTDGDDATIMRNNLQTREKRTFWLYKKYSASSNSHRNCNLSWEEGVAS